MTPRLRSVAVLSLTLAGCGEADQPAAQPKASAMQLVSPAFAEGETIPTEFTCAGAGRSPPLQWSAPPAGTQSFALVVVDPDAPKGTFRHWGVYDIPMSARQLDTGAAQNPAAGLKQTKNDFGTEGYGPPCPPKGDKPHHYHFRLMALDIPGFADEPAKAKGILHKSKGHVLGSAELIGLYDRK